MDRDHRGAARAHRRRRAGAVATVAALVLLPSGIAAGQAPPRAGSPATAGAAVAGHEPSTASTATTVIAWNEHAVTALTNPPTAPVPGAGFPPQIAVLHLAMVQGAAYDAVNSILGSHEPFLDGLPPAPANASQEAAAATAAHRVPRGMTIVPAFAPAVTARLDALYAATLAGVPDGPAEDAGVAAGAAAAAAMLAARADDGRFEPYAFTVGNQPGQWRPVTINDPFAWLANVEPFTLTDAGQFRTKGPHGLTTGAYAREYEEVRRLGAIDSVRTPRQQAVGGFFTVNPVELYNRTFRTVAGTEGLDLAEQARLFAMVNVAGADALIGCWEDKAHAPFWRPITAIRLGDTDGNPATTADPGWTPMVATPPYPEHPSGYNCVTGAMMHTAEDFFGVARVPFTLVRIAAGVPNQTRSYARFRDVIGDTVDARIYQGLHFRAAEVQGAQLGRRVASWVDHHEFRALH